MIGQTIRAHRRALGLTLEDLSLRLRADGHPLSVNVLSRMEQGKRGLSVDELVSLSEALDVLPSLLMFGDGAGDAPLLFVDAARNRDALDAAAAAVRAAVESSGLTVAQVWEYIEVTG